MFSAASFFLVLLFVTGSADNKHSGEVEESLDGDIARHRYKRGLHEGGIENDYFRQYYTDKGLLDNYNNAPRTANGRITNWGGLGDGSTSYTDAIRRSTTYYQNQADAGQNVDAQLNRVQGIVDGRETARANSRNPDRGHQAAIDNWRDGQRRIQDGQGSYLDRCGLNGRKKRGIGALFRGIIGLIARGSARTAGAIRGLGRPGYRFARIRRSRTVRRTSNSRTSSRMRC